MRGSTGPTAARLRIEKPPVVPAAPFVLMLCPAGPARLGQGVIRWTGLPLIPTFQVVTSLDVPVPVIVYLISDRQTALPSHVSKEFR